MVLLDMERISCLQGESCIKHTHFIICADYKIWSISFLIILSLFALSHPEWFIILKKPKPSESNSYIFRPIFPSTWCTVLHETKKEIEHQGKRVFVCTSVHISRTALSQNTRYLLLYFFFLGIKMKTFKNLQTNAFLVICTTLYHGKNLVFISKISEKQR